MARFKSSNHRFSRQPARKRTRCEHFDGPITLDIHDLNQEGEGVSRSLEKVMFVKGALPGEKVEAAVEKQQRHYNYGRLQKIITSSEQRVEPKCDYYKRCGGCQLQHLGTEHQLKYKQNSLDHRLKRHLKLQELPWKTPIHSQGFEYRRRARLAVRYRKDLDQILIGFREESNSHITDIDSCSVLLPPLSQLIEPLKNCISGLSVRAKVTQAEFVQAGDVRVITLRVLQDLPKTDQEILRQWMDNENVQIWIKPDEPKAAYCLADDSPVPLRYSLADKAIEFKSSDFIQSNAEVNEQMVKQALDWLAPKSHETALDLFAGIGNFTLPLATSAAKVIAVEGAAQMVQRLAQNAQNNELVNVDGLVMNLADEHCHNKLPTSDLILLDPPRSGAAALIPWLKQQKARILYVACEPSSLVRDAAALLEAGYKISKIGVMDMFPQTKHVESMALFERK